MIFYDIEVFKHDWLIVCIDSDNWKTHVFTNDRDELNRFYEKNVDNVWVGYNNVRYDQYIFKAILLDMNIKRVNDWIISGNSGYKYSTMFNKITMHNYDTMTSYHSLKTLEGFMGEDIEETQVDFNLDRKLTKDELALTQKYCVHDVEQTIKVFFERIEEFESHLGLINMFKIPLKYISKSKAQLSAMILNACKPNKEREDEFDITIVDTLRLDKYKSVQNWFTTNKLDYKMKLTKEIAGVEHVFGFGGIHGAIPGYVSTGRHLMVDVGSYYPALMIEYQLLSRNVADAKQFREIRDKRIDYKKAGDKRQAPLKIVLNSTYGASKYKYSQLYDPLQANNVCINGQLLLLDLIEKIEPYCTLVQSNTDGLLVRVETESEEKRVRELCKEWENRTRMTLDYDVYNEVYQGDVNNYLMVREDGKIKSKGMYFKQRNNLDNNLAIVQEAIQEYLLNGTPVEDTINNCNELLKFQSICHMSGKYSYCMTGNWVGKGKHREFVGTKLDGKTFRVYATLANKGTLFKVKTGGNPEKFGGISENVEIDNANKLDENFLNKMLDKNWYIEYTKDTLRDKGLYEHPNLLRK